MQCVIISFDSLATNSLGCYGNEWIETPNLDRLASTGAVFDQHFVDSIGPLAGQSWGTGRHPHLPLPDESQTDLAGLLTRGNIASRLIVSGELRNWQRPIPFGSVQSINGQDGPAVKPDETSFAQVVKRAISTWNEPDFQTTPRLLWVHAAGPGVPPTGFDDLYFEDFEERGQAVSQLTDEQRRTHPAVYAGSVSLVDHWLGELLQAIEVNPTDQPTLVIVMSGSGYPWQKIQLESPLERTSHAPGLGDQIARTPLLLRATGDARFTDLVCIRSNRLTQSCDLVPTLIDWFDQETQVSVQNGRSWLRELTAIDQTRPSLFYTDGQSQVAVRTPEWLCVGTRITGNDSLETGASTPQSSLFVKPEDVWDISDVASQHPNVVEELLRSVPPFQDG